MLPGSRIHWGVWFLCSTGAARLAAQEVPAVLSLPGSVRSAGLNGAGAALVGDAGSVFSNPSGLATIRHVSVEGTYRHTGYGVTAATGALGWRLSQFDIGGGIAYLTGDSVPPLGSPSGAGPRPYQAMGIGSLVYRSGLIALSGSLKRVQQQSAGTVARAWSGDVGAAIAFFDIMAIGFVVQNVGGNWESDSTLAMPRLSRFGFSMNYTDPQETYRLMSSVEVQWPKNGQSQWLLGGEAGVVVYGLGVIGRASYRTRAGGTPNPSLTYGASVALARLHVDWAYASRDFLGTSAHRLGVRLTF